MSTASSRNLNTNDPNMRSGRVSTTQQAGYTRLMRFLGYGIAAVTLILVALLAANSEPAPTSGTPDVEVPAQSPHWNGIYAKTFPGCVGTGSFIPARIVVVPREGAARTMRYSDATVTHIDATWNNDNPADDLYTVGKCAR